jgi:hypothetical protein
MEYIVKAYSAQTNETQREINLMSPHPDTEQLAWQMAHSFAQRLNQSNQAKDWVAQIEAVDTLHARTH